MTQRSFFQVAQGLHELSKTDPGSRVHMGSERDGTRWVRIESSSGETFTATADENAPPLAEVGEALDKRERTLRERGARLRREIEHRNDVRAVNESLAQTG